MLAGNRRDWLMRDRTIITLAFLGLCALLVLCLTTLKLCGYDGTVTKCLIGIAAVCFGANFWSLVKSKR